MAVFSLAACGGGRTAADGPERAPSANAPAGAAPASHDVDAAAVELYAKGVPVEGVRVDELTGKRFVFFTDPNGQPLELYEEN